jgi:hypothetical protein
MNDDETVAYNAAAHQLVFLYNEMTDLHMDHLLIGVVQRRIPLGTNYQLLCQLHTTNHR